MVLDANGEANVWIDPALAYKVILTDSADVQQWSVDRVADPNAGEVPQWNPNATYSQGSVVKDASVEGMLYVSLTNTNLNNALTSVANWRMFDGKVRTISATGAALITDNLIRSNSTAGAVTVTLPACSTTPIGKKITVKDVGTGGNTTSVKGAGSDVVDGNNTYATALRQYESVTVVNNGTSWDLASSAGVAGVPDGSISAAKIATDAVETAKIKNEAVTQAKRVALGQQVSSSCGEFSTASATFVDATNLTVTITTTGRPVFLAVISDGSGNPANGGNATSGATLDAQIVRDTTSVAMVSETTFGATQILHPTLVHVDVPAAGTYVYKIQIKAGSGTSHLKYVKLMAFEL